MVATSAIGFAIPIPFFSDFRPVIACIWGLLFVGGFVLPPVTGMMINSIDEQFRASGNSIANMIYNLCGYLPGPFIYGLVSQNFSHYYKNAAMAQLIYSVAIPVILLWIGVTI